MLNNDKAVSRVVYRMKLHGKRNGMPAVCERCEWEAMQRVQPGYHTLVVAGILNESEAERLARNSTADGRAQPPPK